ncbi:hypothetical protein Tco_0478372 [Tanacetum coccineum]
MLPKPNQTIFDALDGVITRIEGWKGRFFFVQDSIVPSTCLELLSKDNRYPTSIHVFPDLILFLAGLKSLWKNFMYPKTDDDLSFLPKEPSLEFGTGSLSVSINTEPPVAETEPTAYVAAKIRERKFRTRGGSLKRPVKHKLIQGASTSRSTRAKAATLKDDFPFLTILDDDEGLPDCLELENANLLDLHDRCYARKAVVDNVVNRRSREMLKVIDQIKAECDVMKEREKARDQDCEELKAKCEATMADFDKNPTVNVFREKIVSLSGENAKLDRAKVVSKVVPYMAMELVNSDDMGRLVAKFVSASILFGRCQVFEEVARMKEPFDITKVKGYRSSYKQEYTRARNELATATFPFLTDVVVDPQCFRYPPSKKAPCVSKVRLQTRTPCAHFKCSILECPLPHISDVLLPIIDYSYCCFNVQDTISSFSSVKATMLPSLLPCGRRTKSPSLNLKWLLLVSWYFEACFDSIPLRWRLLPCLRLPSFYLLSCDLCLWGSCVPRVSGLGHPPILAEIGLAASRCGSLSQHAPL